MGRDGSVPLIALGHLAAIVTPLLVVGELAQGRSRALMFVGIATLLVNLSGNAFAVPARGAVGAAMVLCLSEAFALL